MLSTLCFCAILLQLAANELCPRRRRKRAGFELVDSQRLRFEDHGLRDNVALLTLLRPRRQQEAPTGQPRQQSSLANGGAAVADGAAGNGAPAGQQNGVGGVAPAAVAAGSGAAAAGSGGGPPLLFGNTHILFNPKRGDIKVRSETLKLRRLLACGNVQTAALVHEHAAYLARPLCTLPIPQRQPAAAMLPAHAEQQLRQRAVTSDTSSTLTLASVTVCWR